MKFLCGIILVIVFSAYIISKISADHHAIINRMEEDIIDNSLLTTPCTIKLIKRYIHAYGEPEGRFPTAVISQLLRSAFQQRYLLKGIHQSEEISILMKKPNIYHYSAERVFVKSKVYVLFLTRAEEILDHLQLLEILPTYTTFAKMILIFPRQMKPIEFENERKKAFKLLFENDFFDIYVIGTRYNTTTLESYTTFPYDNGNCAKKSNIIEQLIDECQTILKNTEGPFDVIDDLMNLNQTRMELVEYRKFYPKIPDEITGCEIPVTVSNFEPYVVIDPITKQITKGVEVLIINTTFNELGAKVKFYQQDAKRRYKRISLDNETGVFADILNQKSIFLCGGFRAQPKLNRSIQSTIPYTNDDVTWCVHTADLAPAWLNTFKTYSGALWLAIGISIAVSTITLFIFIKFEQRTKHHNLAWSFLNIFGTFISIFTIKYDPRKIFIRIFMGSLLFAGINLWAAYTSSLISILTNPRYNKQISSVPEAVEAGYVFYGNINYLEYILANQLNEPGYAELVKNYRVCESVDQCFDSFINDKNSAIASSRIQARHNARALSIEKFCFDENNNLYEYSVSTLSYPYHHLLPLLDEMIGLVLQAGLIVKWTRDVAIQMEYDDEGAAKKLTLEHLQGAFVMLGIGLFIAIIAFIIEWIYFVHKNGKALALTKLNLILKSFGLKLDF